MTSFIEHIIDFVITHYPFRYFIIPVNASVGREKNAKHSYASDFGISFLTVA